MRAPAFSGVMDSRSLAKARLRVSGLGSLKASLASASIASGLSRTMRELAVADAPLPAEEVAATPSGEVLETVVVPSLTVRNRLEPEPLPEPEGLART